MPLCCSLKPHILQFRYLWHINLSAVNFLYAQFTTTIVSIVNINHDFSMRSSHISFLPFFFLFLTNIAAFTAYVTEKWLPCLYQPYFKRAEWIYSISLLDSLTSWKVLLCTRCKTNISFFSWIFYFIHYWRVYSCSASN